ncbi:MULTISPECIES: alanine--tRNA ligase [unclassified Herbaspirillum]|uniref:alanine--tRNA ligase n=1 Tax=unclassified Herbaspirillum TaxID=2624150 RepID=UPI001153E4F9|nr:MULTISPECIES: alanine--tRNA ligase [unclassified Herbaspirillum]MBB5391456.1 alanyl-tRNA synthetase [Herbaspirillum sp. SJZ102]TQK12859.1 alanyl-tRNA synthetase [Herbaspirillum sp. SJZ130]TQK14863.1 alanyl-tRNA synthetase [Herbaspirillum sp. SJZ106]TWC67218.1 alanyl-tRNA synthetase [Herbaspirillum sp. SJZ099]
MNSAEIRDKFLKFFESQGHTIVRSSSLVPGNDPTLLFTNSGMVQFKDVFLGTDKRNYVRAASVQRCLRAGGKHNDLENVGYTARHHTFFEMLGNWSFGDYFKRESLKWAWELLTKVYGLPAEKLWATVYETDDEAYDIWTKEIGVPSERVVRIGDNKGAPYASDNFWQMAETGPCGPCSEIFYDHGPDVWGGPPGSPDADGDRYIEIWNNVFMQFDRQIDPKTGEYVLTPLPAPCVDTGMGLERLAAILQHVHSNYEIDLFQALIKAAARETNTTDLANNSLKVIADHIRATSFLIVDGVIPGNEGRGYVLRRIIRRALRHGHKLGQTKPFFYKLVKDLVAQMGAAYPELPEAAARVEQVLQQEEERFGETLEHGMKILEAALAANTGKLDGETAFTLYDTYGFPLDLTADICRERNVELDEAGFAAAMERQKSTARAAGKFKMAAAIEYAGDKTKFVGYESLAQQAKVLALYVAGSPVQKIDAGQDAIVVLDATPFYAESGGQSGDAGVLEAPAGALFAVADTQKIQADVFGHHGQLIKGSLAVGDTVAARVDADQRARTMRNHSATHLMHKALREVLGSHVSQKGSLVDADKTRFDFSHNAPMTAEEIRRVEEIVNREVLANAATSARLMGYDDAIAAGAMALFGEKYGDEVRVLSIGTSTELCGGTHVARTGDIGLFKIVSEGGVAAGIRRVEAVTGEGALALVQSLSNRVAEAAAALKTQPEELLPRIGQVQDQVKALEKELAALKSKLASSQGDELVSQAVDIKGIKVLAATLEGADVATLREAMDKLKDKLKSAAIVLASVKDGKVSLIAGVTADATAKVKAGELVNFVAQQVGGKGGGRPDMAQAGGTDPSGLPGALKGVADWVGAKF